MNVPPREVSLTFSEPVEPRFAVISVTDAARPPADGRAAAALAGRPRTRSSSRSRPIAEGWYLVYWRAISVDGHPVRGAFTFAVGPNPGPAPQFVIPSISETAATPRLIAARSIAFLVGDGRDRAVLLADRSSRGRCCGACQGTSLRAVSIAFGIASAVALVAVPVYVALATAQFALRSVDRPGRDRAADARLGVRARLPRPRALRRAVRRSRRRSRSSIDRPRAGAPLGRRAARAERRARRGRRGRCSSPGLVGPSRGRPRRAASRSRSTGSHLAAGSVWIGGLIGLLVLWAALPRDAARGRARRRRAAVLERRARLGARARRVGDRRVDPPPADALSRCGRPPTGRRCSSRSRCSARRCSSRR